ncbi:MAG: PIG-L family deacetylase, partial [Marinirhabdus sp.]|nr:PIG-L family deacetylase [Marinirhabdus sp.]
MFRKQKAFLALFIFSFATLVAQQPSKPTASEIYHNLQKVNFVGSALYVAAHPDDENTRLISYLANDVKARTAYLSLTRGDGGQNLVGPEIRELLGVIRTQELLAARRTDGGQQLFTRANDFGYSKHPDETLAIWNKEEVLGDVVRAIRKFKPDIIVNRFNHRNPGSTHGHHTSSAMLSVEAFDILNDASKYPASAKAFGTWQPKRLFFNTSWWFYGSQENFEKADKTNLVEVETGGYYPLLGLSNGEIASLSRSMHKSQGFGSTGSRGSQTEYLEFLKGDFPKDKSNLFDGIDTSWSRLEGGDAIGAILNPLEENFNFQNPSAMLPELTKAYDLVKNLKDEHWRKIKMEQLQSLILDCGGIFLEAVASENSVIPRSSYEVTVEAINRSDYPVVLNSIHNSKGTLLLATNETLLPNQKKEFTLTIPNASASVSAPYWLKEEGTLGMYRAPEDMIGMPETPAPEQLLFDIQLQKTSMKVNRNVVYKYTDPVKGEVYQPLEVLPAVSSSIPEKVLIFSSEAAREVPVVVTAGQNNITGSVTLQHPKGWVVQPSQGVFNIEKKGQSQTLQFTVIPPKEQSEGALRSLVQVGDQYFDKELVTIDYDHI